MKTRKLYLVIVFAAALTTGCNNRNVPQITPTSSGRIHLPTIVEKYSTPLPSNRASTTLILPSRTLDPTEQMWMMTVTSLHQARDKAFDATQQTKFAVGTKFPNACPSTDVSTSPDESWLVCNPYGEFSISNRDGSKTWRINYDDLYTPPNNPDMIGGVYPIYWTPDSLYLYFTTSYCCVDTDKLSNAEALYRLDVLTGKWLEVIPGVFNYFSFSPTGRHLIHIPWDLSGYGNPVVLNIIDLKTGDQEKTYIDGFEQAGYIYWKRDGKAFAMTFKNGNFFMENERFSIIMINIENKAVKTILSDAIRGVYVTSWSEDEILEITTTKYIESIDMVIPEYLYYDANTNRFVSEISNPTNTP